MTRIPGRVTTSDNLNNFYPKFTVRAYYNPLPIKEVIMSPSQHYLIEPGERVYEPVEGGLGTKSNTLYVFSGDTTYLLYLSVDHDITWGSWIVQFSDNVTMGGDRL